MSGLDSLIARLKATLTRQEALTAKTRTEIAELEKAASKNVELPFGKK